MRRGLTVGILVTLAGFLILVLVPHGDVVDTHQSPAPNVLPRQVVSASVAGTSPAAPASQPTSNTPTSQAAAPTSAAAAPSSQQQQASSTSAAPASTAQQQSSSQAADTSTNKASNAASTSAAAPTTVTSALVTTNQGGQVITSIIIVADTPTPSASASQSAAASNNSGGGGSGVSTSTIIGLSVAGGVAVLCVVGFFVWKFTRKRIGDYDNSCVFFFPPPHYGHTSLLTFNRRRGDKVARAQRARYGCPPANKPHGWSRLRYRCGRTTKLDRIRTLHGSQLDSRAPRPLRHPPAAPPRPQPALPRRSQCGLLRPVPRARPPVLQQPGRPGRGDPDDAARRDGASLARPGRGVRRGRLWERSRVAGASAAWNPCGLRQRRLWRTRVSRVEGRAAG